MSTRARKLGLIVNLEQLTSDYVRAWTPESVRALIRRGRLRKNLHYFQPFGRRSQLLFDVDAIQELIRNDITPATKKGPKHEQRRLIVERLCDRRSREGIEGPVALPWPPLQSESRAAGHARESNSGGGAARGDRDDTRARA